MQIKSSVKNDSLFISLDGSLDELSLVNKTCTIITNPIVETMNNLINKTKARKIVLDFSKVHSMDDFGIGFLIGRYKKAKDRNIPIYTLNLSKDFEELFDIKGKFNLCDFMPKFQEND